MDAITTHGLVVIVIALVAFYFMARGRLSVELSSLLILASLALVFHFFPFKTATVEIHATDFFYGFGHEALIAICCLMIHGHALVVTGALEPVARALGKLWIWNAHIALLAVLLVSMLLSGVVNDTPVVILMMPLLLGVALRTGTAPSKTLMPMNFAVLAGGMATSIGTSTNLLVVSIAADLGVGPFSVFYFTKIALLGAIPAILYLWLVAPRLLEDRRPPMESTEPRIYQAVLHIETGSFPDGKTLAETLKRAGTRMQLDHIQRGTDTFLKRFPSLVLRAGDCLFVRGTPADIKEFEQSLKINLHTVEQVVQAPSKLEQLAEVVVTDDSDLAGRSLFESRFYDRYGLTAIAIHRHKGEVLLDKLSEARLQSGDVLLMQGEPENIARLKIDPSVLVLDGRLDLPRTAKAPTAFITMFCVVLAAGLGWVPIYMGALLGVCVLLLTQTVPLKNFGRALKADVILLIAASLALGKAVTATGVAQSLGTQLALHAAALPPSMTLGILMAIMALMTNFVSNNAAAAVGTPLAVYVAKQLHLPAEPFVLAVLFGCNLSFATPMGYQTNILIMAAANYRFSDYFKVGLPLIMILMGVLSYALSQAFF